MLAYPFSWNFLTQELNQGLLHCKQILCQLSYQGSPKKQLMPPEALPGGPSLKIMTGLRYRKFSSTKPRRIYGSYKPLSFLKGL